MMTHTYIPGNAVGVVAPGVAVLVDLAAGDPLTGELLAAVTEEPTLEAVIDVLLSHGLRKLGSFAAAALEPDGVRVVVRGDFTAIAAGEEPISASGLWTDRILPGSDAVTLTVHGRGGALLPIVQGAVLADSLNLGAPVARLPREAVAAAQPAPVDVPAPATAAPEPLPELVEAIQAEPSVAPAVPEPVGPEPESSAPVGSEGELWAAVTPEPELPEPAAPEPPSQPPFPAQPSVAAGKAAVPGLLIESFPWADAPAAPLPAPVPGSAATPAEPPPAPAPAWSGGFDGESMEMTVDRSRLIGHANASTSSVLVVAARCPAGHLSPAYAEGCRVCHQPLPPQQPTEVPRPPLGVLRLSNGDAVALDRGAILGRNPHLPFGYASEQPNLVRLSDPGKDISSQHLEVTLDYWHVLVTDLGSTNGTEVLLPGQAAVRLQPNDPMTIEPGTRVVLAGVFDFVYEVTG